MMTTLREAMYFSRNQFQPLLIIALLSGVPFYFLEIITMSTEGDPDRNTAIGIMIVSMCLNVIQFGAAMLYIDHVSHGRAISVSKAIGMALARFAGLFVLNILMAIVIGTGLLLLVIPGIFFGYKLFFSEIYLLLQQQDPITALKSSFNATTGLASELLPPLLAWGIVAVTASMLGSSIVHSAEGLEWAALLLHQIVMMSLSIYGWALAYRLYQRYLESSIDE
ncbi:YciC family protein [Motiliproteus sp. MSK22-1]|uniref:YciC family protein n=1 Tax=Motiliproteus sp. MSK22-1 TaxID=1897630 RepID=UPI0009768E24|nr:YciC family protein [Motiliproteus sp. MSK22-1]OMH34799.1 hypothetical protein BGP75_10870 [Motiliproteus sp. MSK22-1]